MNAFAEYEKRGVEEPSSSMGIYVQQTQNNLVIHLSIDTSIHPSKWIGH
jgi:hypothetical protein